MSQFKGRSTHFKVFFTKVAPNTCAMAEALLILEGTCFKTMITKKKISGDELTATTPGKGPLSVTCSSGIVDGSEETPKPLK